MSFKSRLCRAYHFLSLLTIEPYLFVVYFLLALKQTPTTQLVQDKICLFKFKLPANYCLALPEMTPEEDFLDQKSAVLSESNTFTIYGAMFMTLPGLVAGFFVGPWTDKYLKAKKILLIIGSIATICEAFIGILNIYYYEFNYYGMIMTYLPTSFSGGILALFTSIYAYIILTTPTRLRSLRLAVTEVLSAIAKPLGTYLAGRILNSTPLFNGGQLYNYTTIYAIAGISHVLMLAWTIFFIDEERDTIEWDKRFGDIDTESDEKPVLVTDKLKRFDQYKGTHPIKLLFNLSNIKDMLRTCFKKRPDNIRLQIWLLFLATACFLIAHVGPIIFLFSFVQKVYNWNNMMYSNVLAANNIIDAIVTIILAPIFIRVLMLRDTTMGMIGTIAYFAQCLIRGTVLNPTGYYISIPVGCLGAMASIGLKTHMSKIISTKEQGKVFSLLSIIDSLMPLIAAGFFTQIFNATMDSNPGLSFILTAVLLVIPFWVMVWIHFCTKLPNLDSEQLHVNTDEDENMNEESNVSKC